jgi:hypothetical protein
MEAPKCRTCGKRHWSRVCETFDVALETEIVSQVTKNVALKADMGAYGTTVADLKEILADAEAEVRQLRAKVVLLEAELEVRKPKAMNATERSRKWRARHGG